MVLTGFFCIFLKINFSSDKSFKFFEVRCSLKLLCGIPAEAFMLDYNKHKIYPEQKVYICCY